MPLAARAFVCGGIKHEFAGMNLLQTRRLKGRHELAPVMNGLAQNPEISRDSSSIPVVKRKYISTEHVAQSTPVDHQSKRSRQETISSGIRQSPVGYLPMGTSRRIVRKTPFNGWVIRDLRLKRDMSLDQLAGLSGMKKANLSKIERARSHVAMSYDNFLDLARALYIPPEELRRRLSETTPTPPAAPGIRDPRRA